MVLLPLSGVISIEPVQDTRRCTLRAPGLTGGSFGTAIPIESRETMLSARETTPPIPGIGCGSIAHFLPGSFTPQMYLPDSTQCTPTCPALALPGLPTQTTRKRA